jgi:hypothetical protein
MRSVNHTRDLRYHPHVHYLVPAGALAPDGARWIAVKGQFLVHTKPLAKLFRGKMRAGLRQLKLEKEVASETWSKPWVVDCRPVGTGQAALKYLAPYVFRVALSNNRIVRIENDQVTFRYRDGESKKTKLCTLPAEEFIRRFLQHVLPKGFVKVRSFGLFSPGMRHRLAQVREVLAADAACTVPAVRSEGASASVEHEEHSSVECPACGAVMELTQVLLPLSRSPPGDATWGPKVWQAREGEACEAEAWQVVFAWSVVVVGWVERMTNWTFEGMEHLV